METPPSDDFGDSQRHVTSFAGDLAAAMNVESAASNPGETVREVLWAKWIVLSLMAYYAAFAIVAPAMNYDSQVYNLARLAIAQTGGLFGNHGWNSEREVLFPWSFDAIHYPFLFLRRGDCLPSFACFVGLQIIVYRLVAEARSARQAWWCCLALLAMPTVVFQAVCTKNDLAVVFAVGCWYYAWRLWRNERRDVYLLSMSLALSFAAGSKTTGLPFFGALGTYTLWQLRADRRAAVRFAVCMVAGFALLGSVEIYLNNALVYHSPLGRPAFLAQNKNRDGFSGATANFIRYCFGNLNVGIDAANPASPVAGWLQNACREFLRFVHFLGFALRALAAKLFHLPLGCLGGRGGEIFWDEEIAGVAGLNGNNIRFAAQAFDFRF